TTSTSPHVIGEMRMSRSGVVRWTGAFGLAAIVAQLSGAIVSSAAGSAPAVDDPAKFLTFVKNSQFALTTVLMLFLIGFSLFIGFTSGLRGIAIAAAPEREWLATTVFGPGGVLTVLGRVGTGLAFASVGMW